MKKIAGVLFLLLNVSIFTGCVSAGKRQEVDNQWKYDLLEEFYSMADESDFTDELDSIQLSDGKWRMIYYNVYNSPNKYISLSNKEWQFVDRIDGNCWEFILKDGEPAFTEGWDYEKFTLEGDAAEFLKDEPWRKWGLEGNEYFGLGQNAYKKDDTVKKCSELLKNKVLPGVSKQLPEDSPIVIKTNQARTKFIYDYGTNWRPYFYGMSEDSPLNSVAVYFFKVE